MVKVGRGCWGVRLHVPAARSHEETVPTREQCGRLEERAVQVQMLDWEAAGGAPGSYARPSPLMYAHTLGATPLSVGLLPLRQWYFPFFEPRRLIWRITSTTSSRKPMLAGPSSLPLINCKAPLAYPRGSLPFPTSRLSGSERVTASQPRVKVLRPSSVPRRA